MPRSKCLKVMVLAGGPDRERAVSQLSGQAVAATLREAGHEVLLRDVMPDDLACLDEFVTWGGDVIFPALHGNWGEGGPLQRILDARRLRYVGCGPQAAELCMDKHRTKWALQTAGLPTAAFELLREGDPHTLPAPLVLKPPCEGSSIDLVICRTPEAADRARAELHRRHAQLLCEAFVAGMELTVSVIGNADGSGRGCRALSPIHIVPATEFYDYQAKYERDDTQYRFDIDLPAATLDELRAASVRAFITLGCRDLARVDFIVDAQNRPWILEVNTMPGFTSHSLLPMAAAHDGMPMSDLVDGLVRGWGG